MKRAFTKPATTYAEQVALLRQRGMRIDDPDRAAFYLQHINYYRLGAYWLPFEVDHGSHRFHPDTSFETVLDLYVFDRELRLLTLDAIERIEVSLRSQWAYQMAHRHGPHAHLDAALAHKQGHWEANREKLRVELGRSDEAFVQHLTNTYSEALPPVWAVCEVMSLGLLSRWYGNLKPMPTRRAIADVYGLDQRVLESWMHHLTFIRNTCAHHSRLWNREFTITAELPRSKPRELVSEFVGGSRKLYNTLVILLHLMDIVAPQHHWRARLLELIGRHSVPLAAMDFPDGWQARPIWKRGQP
ncbi:Abi family protein [Rhodocyclus purpureus]|uniref:Abi family protein n=1 Tax=Rhodocyclus purpureus TaxID=1067 RepID=UPI00191449D9|nr:Abi family protein [Rhodocyclus purpureus]MBK5913876.1 DNA-binding protein [Rhodocyclus purpureus]